MNSQILKTQLPLLNPKLFGFGLVTRGILADFDDFARAVNLGNDQKCPFHHLLILDIPRKVYYHHHQSENIPVVASTEYESCMHLA